jgi:hypothetical protein
LQSPTYQGKYVQLIAKLRTELERCDEAFAVTLARADAAATTRNRIDDLASTHRRSQRRN